MIYKAKHHFFIYPFFQRYTLWKLRRAFHEVHIIGGFTDKKWPVLILANHISWWDGFWMMYLNLKMLNRKFHFMMQENQLRKYWALNLAGGYSVKKNSRSILQTIQYTVALLKSSGNMVFLFPQGKITSMHETQIAFESGIGEIIRRVENEIHILFVANIVEYWSNPKPSLSIHVESYTHINSDEETLQDAYNTFYLKALNYHKNSVE